MAIDPGISLGIRPPQIAPLQIQTPLDRYQKMLTLRHLMTQGQLGQMNLEQTRLENEALHRKAQGEQALSELLRNTPNATTQQLVQTCGLYASPLIKQRLDAQKAALEAEEATVKSLTSAAQGIAALPEDQQDFAYRAERARRVTANPAMAQMFPEQFQGKGWLDQQINAGLTAQQYYEKIRAEQKAQQEKPGIVADSFRKRVSQLATIGAPKLKRSKDEYAKWLTSLAPEEQEVFRDAADPLEVQKRAQTPEQYVTAEERERHDKAIEDYQLKGQTATKAHQLAGSEATLRQDYLQVFRPFQQVADMYGALQSARTSDDPFKDLTYVFSFMKMLEPTSAVMRGEALDVETRRAIPDWLANLYDNVSKGNRLNPQQRSQIENAADRLYKQRSADYKHREESFRQTAVRQGLNPENVIVPFGTTEPQKPPPPQSLVESVVNQANAPTAAQTPTPAAPRKKTYQGREYIFDETQQVWVRQ